MPAFFSLPGVAKRNTANLPVCRIGTGRDATMSDLFLGRTPANEEVRLPLNALLRHAVCLGSAGSGKTVTCKVLCEEFIRQGIPIIAVDPQGDIDSLGQLADEEER